VAVYLDGCFWHGCPTHGSTPRANQAYWVKKIDRNKERDLRNSLALGDAGWRVLRFWEHQSVDEIVEAIRLSLDR
jgi:DNA mismatch endonuclease (patch repair protein)